MSTLPVRIINETVEILVLNSQNFICQVYYMSDGKRVYYSETASFLFPYDKKTYALRGSIINVSGRIRGIKKVFQITPKGGYFRFIEIHEDNSFTMLIYIRNQFVFNRYFIHEDNRLTHIDTVCYYKLYEDNGKVMITPREFPGLMHDSTLTIRPTLQPSLPSLLQPSLLPLLGTFQPLQPLRPIQNKSNGNRIIVDKPMEIVKKNKPEFINLVSESEDEQSEIEVEEQPEPIPEPEPEPEPEQKENKRIEYEDDENSYMTLSSEDEFSEVTSSSSSSFSEEEKDDLEAERNVNAMIDREELRKEKTKTTIELMAEEDDKAPIIPERELTLEEKIKLTEEYFESQREELGLKPKKGEEKQTEQLEQTGQIEEEEEEEEEETEIEEFGPMGIIETKPKTKSIKQFKRELIVEEFYFLLWYLGTIGIRTNLINIVHKRHTRRRFVCDIECFMVIEKNENIIRAVQKGNELLQIPRYKKSNRVLKGAQKYTEIMINMLCELRLYFYNKVNDKWEFTILNNRSERVAHYGFDEILKIVENVYNFIIKEK